mmetsp:Transcript_8579/g.14814  ORF Transcript_8579/g.14814 Transcript_8579/m.14814 type:complete len:224 (-) Transcript_8579:414-1085(-)
MCSHTEFSTALKLFDAPHNSVYFWFVFALAHTAFEERCVGVGGHGHNDFDVVGSRALFKRRFGLDHVFDARVGVTFDERLDPDQRLDVGGETVRHQLKLAVGRNKRNGAIALKRRQFDTLMKRDVFHFNGAFLATQRLGRLPLHAVVETETQLRHAAQMRVQVDFADNLGAKQRAIARHQQIDALNNVEKHFVLARLDALWTPTDRACHCCWHHHFFFLRQFV